MPSKTPKQAKFMRAVAHGWKPSRMKSPPSRAVAREFVEADKKYSGGFAENRYARGGLAFMNEVDSNSERARPLRGFQLGGGTAGIAGMWRRAREMAEGSQDPEESPYGTEAGTTQQMLDRMGYSGPMGYLRLTSGLRQAGWTPASGSGDGDLANTMWYPPEQTLTGEDAPPPRITPTDPASYVGGTASGTSGGGGGGGGGGSREESPYREQLREHKAKIAATLGSARGGHVNYYQEGGAARPGHAEGPNPFEGKNKPAQYRLWERENHIDPPPPPAATTAEPEEIPWWKKLAGYGTPTVDEDLAEMEQAYGGRVNYQAGGLAIAAPAGGVPPWISPTGSGPGYMDEPPPGYQFGGIADRFNPPAAAPPPVAAPPQGQIMNQAQSAFNAQTGGPRGGVMGGQYRGVPPQRGMISRGAQPGGLAAMGQQARQQQRGFMGMAGRGELGPGTTRRYNMSPEAYRGATDAQRRAAEMMGGPGGGSMGRLPPGIDPRAVAADPAGYARQQRGFDQFGNSPQDLAANREASDAWRASGMQGNVNDFMAENYPDLPQLQNAERFTGRVQAGGGMYTDPRHPAYSPPGSGGSFNMSGRYTPPTQGPLAGHDPTGGRPWGGGRGKPRPGPGMFPQGDERGPVGGGVIGGPRVPPNMRGYMQKQRMMNRPPANVGGGANRVGMQDQQGALSRAMQRGTGRAPPSRRFGRGRAGRGRGFEAQ